VAQPIAKPPALAEAAVIAEEMSRAYLHRIAYYRRAYGLKPEEARELADKPTIPEFLDRARHGDPQQLTWGELHELMRMDPNQGAERWQEIAQAGRDWVASGHAAAKALEGWAGRPWDRAVYFALIAELEDQWEPQNGVERALLASMAQAQFEQYRWLEYGSSLQGRERKQQRQHCDQWEEPTVSTVQAQDRAYEMADRWNRAFLRNLRALRDLRRYAVNVTIQGPGQVNVGR
jgi:hypothetical protein